MSLGDASVLSEGTSYADIVAAELEVEYAELADAALTTAGIEGYVAANAEEIAKADLITVSLGTSDISGFVLEQVEAYVNGADTTIDWTAYVAEAKDASGLDLKANITVDDSALDTSMPDVYTVTLTVTDYAGNTASADVEVEVVVE